MRQYRTGRVASPESVLIQLNKEIYNEKQTDPSALMQVVLSLDCQHLPRDTFSHDSVYFNYSVVRQLFHIQNNPKNLDPDPKTDLDFWMVLEGKKVIATLA